MTEEQLVELRRLAEAATPTNRLERDGYHIYYRANFAEWQAHAVFNWAAELADRINAEDEGADEAAYRRVWPEGKEERG